MTPLEAARIPASSTPRVDLCPVTETIKIIGKKWYLIILHELTRGPRGFNELRRSVRGISAKVLSESLQHLERKALVTRTIHSEAPIRVEYALTQKGAELESLFDDMKAWGEKWDICADADKEPNARFRVEPGQARAAASGASGASGPAGAGRSGSALPAPPPTTGAGGSHN